MREQGFSLIGSIIVVALVLVLALFFIYGSPLWEKREPQRADKRDTNVITGSKARANDAVCMNGLRQVRYAIDMEKMSSGAPPASLQSLSGVPKEMLVCPIGGEPYQYDPGSGTVRCPHPGHERY
ncbi:MAG: hypothetical protein AMXMBFR61_19030 [Fimbriimonadales bacterium]